MPTLVSVNYLIKYRNGDLILLTDTFSESRSPIAYQYIEWDDEQFSPARITLTDMMDIIQSARSNEGVNIYVFEEWN